MPQHRFPQSSFILSLFLLMLPRPPTSPLFPYTTLFRSEIACFPLDGSLRVLVVAPVMTNLNASGGGDDYSKEPKGNLDVTDRKSTRLNSSHRTISYAVFCLKKKKKSQIHILQRG